MCETEEPHGFPLDTMQFMDWRDGHLSPDYKEMNNDHPTFLYAMPFTDRKIFFEVGLCKLNRMPDLSGLS